MQEDGSIALWLNKDGTSIKAGMAPEEATRVGVILIQLAGVANAQAQAAQAAMIRPVNGVGH
jgi:hypothetical protein